MNLREKRKTKAKENWYILFILKIHLIYDHNSAIKSSRLYYRWTTQNFPGLYSSAGITSSWMIGTGSDGFYFYYSPAGFIVKFY
jgi:hypothetical protein